MIEYCSEGVEHSFEAQVLYQRRARLFSDSRQSRAVPVKWTNRLSSINIAVRRIKSLLTSSYDPALDFCSTRLVSTARHEAVIKPINWQREGRRQESFHNTRKAREVVAGRSALPPAGSGWQMGKVGFLSWSTVVLPARGGTGGERGRGGQREISVRDAHTHPET